MIPSASLNISSKCFNPYSNFTEEILILQSQTEEILSGIEAESLLLKDL